MAGSEISPRLGRSIVQIANPSDLTVIIVQYKDTSGNNDEGELLAVGTEQVEQEATILVNKDQLIKSSVYFKTMLSGHYPWRETSTNEIRLEGDGTKAMEIWFRHFHSTLAPETVPFSSVSTADVWRILLAAEKYDFNLKDLQSWFVGWFDERRERLAQPGGLFSERWGPTARALRRDSVFLARQNLLPAFKFDHPKAFLGLTKKLAYQYVGHITESNPTSIQHLHLPRRIIQQLNAAKGRLRTILHRKLFEACSDIVATAQCSCKEKTVFNYLKELHRIEVWPIEDLWKNTSIEEILHRLKYFEGKSITSSKIDDPFSPSANMSGPGNVVNIGDDDSSMELHPPEELKNTPMAITGGLSSNAIMSTSGLDQEIQSLAKQINSLSAKVGCDETNRKKLLDTLVKAMAGLEVPPGGVKKTDDISSKARLDGTTPRKGQKPVETACRHCNRDWESIVESARTETEEYFDGLCLDCMDKTKNQTDDSDYWNHVRLARNYDAGCRTRHGESTWYHSFMGRREKKANKDRVKRTTT